MTDQPAADCPPTTEDLAAIEARARTERLLRIPADQITRYSVETILDWLDARREQHVAGGRAACRVLREQGRRRERAYARLAAAAGGPVAVDGDTQ